MNDLQYVRDMINELKEFKHKIISLQNNTYEYGNKVRTDMYSYMIDMVDDEISFFKLKEEEFK